MRQPHRDPFAPCLLRSLAALFLFASLAAADGGTVRLSERKGAYQITVFTAPTPLRAGPVDVSVFVQDAATGESVPDVRVTVTTRPREHPGAADCHVATIEAATNKLFYAAIFELPDPGWSDMEVAIEGCLGQVQTRFEVEAAEPMPRWLDLWPWFGWPALPIMLFCVRISLSRQRDSWASQERKRLEKQASATRMGEPGA